jgi:hypothetical protein
MSLKIILARYNNIMYFLIYNKVKVIFIYKNLSLLFELLSFHLSLLLICDGNYLTMK